MLVAKTKQREVLQEAIWKIIIKDHQNQVRLVLTEYQKKFKQVLVSFLQDINLSKSNIKCILNVYLNILDFNVHDEKRTLKVINIYALIYYIEVLTTEVAASLL